MKNSIAYKISALLFVISLSSAYAQTRIYKQYGIEDGLANENVYLSYQDSKGFMWFATEQGLSQFDSKHFKNYTTQDGLPSNDVLQISEDSAGRLWMICYSPKVCYMYNGVVHNAESDSILSQINSEGSLFRDITIDSQGGVWIYGPKIYRIYKDKVFAYRTPNDITVLGMGYFNNRFAALAYNGLYEIALSDTEIHYKLLLPVSEENQSKSVFANGNCYLMQAGKRIRLLTIKPNLLVDTIKISETGAKEIISSFGSYRSSDSLFLFASLSHGIMACKPDESRILKGTYDYLPRNIAFSRIHYDREGNTWISTLGAGVIFIPLYETYQYTLNKKLQNPTATCVQRLTNGQLIVGMESSFAISSGSGFNTYKISVPGGVFTKKRVVRFCNLNHDSVVIGTDFGLYIMNINKPGKITKITQECIKNVIYVGVDSVLVAANTHTFILKPKQNTYNIEILSDIRSTSLVRDKQGKIWVGMLNGLFTYNNKLIRFSKNKLIDASQITDLLVDEYNNIWVATHQYGIFIIKSDTILRISSKNGLPEDVCIRFFKECDGKIWICTNRHVSSISYVQHKKLRYTVSNEEGLFNLNSTINDVYVDSATIWIAGSNGLIRVNRNKRATSTPLIYITSLATRDSTYNNPKSISLNYLQNNIQINYIGLAYNGTGCNTYKYVLNNSDTVYTPNMSINFSSMPAGKHSLKVWAQNSLGLWSYTPAEVTFEIYPPFWKTWWFNIIAVFACSFSIWAFMAWRIRRIKIQEIKKTDLHKKMAEAQLQALRAQINEHFIFNSLNAIQSFINQNELKAANLFLANFGKLIRRTLDISFSHSITLQEEMDYIENYLLLEKIRYDGRFYYKMTNEVTTIPAHHIILPSMILQPYVENAIRHGLRHKTDEKGVLNISFFIEDDCVVCCIADNGIGRKMAKELKQKLHIEYQSRGMNLSAERIALFNKTQDNKISINIEDGAHGIGTVVKVKVPLKFFI